MWLSATREPDCFTRRPRIFTERISEPAVLALVLVFAVSVIPRAASAEYLSDLAAEAEKVEARQFDSANPGDAAGPGGASANARPQATCDQFESLLEKNYLGTFGFYKKLPERSRQEIFAEYRDGAPISEVRKKIIDRLLQR